MSVDVTSLVIQTKSDGITDAVNSLNKLVEAADKAEKSSAKLSATVKILSDSAKTVVPVMDSLLASYKRQETQLEQNVIQSNAYANAMRSVTSTQAAIATSVGALATSMAALASSLTSVQGNLQGVDRAQRTSNESMREAHALARGLSGSFGALWVTYGNLAGMAAGLAIGTSLKGIVEVGRDVESTLESIRVRGNETTDAVDRMRKSVYELGQGVYGPQEVAKAFETLILAGLKADQALSAISSTMNLAVAGGTSIEKAASTLVSVGTSIGYVAEGFNRVGDVISKTAALSMSSVETLSEAFKSASSVASLYGVTLEDIGTSLGVLSNLGIQGSAAGTALKNMYKELNSEADKVQKTFKQLGISQVTFKDAEGNFKPLLTVVKELDGALSKLSGNEEKMAIARLSNERGLRLITAALDQYRIKTAEGGNALEEFQSNVTNSYGFMAKAAVQMSLTADNQMKMVTNSLKTGFAEAFSTIQPEIIGISSKLKEAFQSEGFKDGLRGLAVLFANMAEALANNIPVVVKLAEAFAIMKAGFIVASVWQSATAGIQAFSAAVASGAVSMSVFNVAMGAVAAVIGVAALAWIAYRTAQEDANKAQKAAIDYSKGYIEGIRNEADNLEKVNEKLREGIALKDVQKKVDSDNSRLLQIQKEDDAVKEARTNLKAAQDAISNSTFFKDDMEKTSKLFLAKKALIAAEEHQRQAAIAAFDEELRLNRLAKENAELVEQAARNSKSGRDTPTLTLETKDKTKAIGLSAIEAELAAIKAADEEKKRILISESKAYEEMYRAKAISVVDYQQKESISLKARQDLITETYAKEVSAILISENLKGRSETERNELAKKRSDLYTKWVDEIAKLNDALTANGMLVSKVYQKEQIEAQAASDRMVDSTEKRTALIQAQIDAYDSLPEAVRKAGVTEKQMADEVIQAQINALQKKKDVLEELAGTTMYDSDAVARLTSQLQAMEKERSAATTRGVQRDNNNFNLGFAARAKEEATMAIQAFNDAGKTIASGLQDIFGDAAKPVASFFNAITTGFAKQTAAQEKFNKTQEAYKNAPEKVKELKMQEAQIALTNEQAQANMGMYAGVAGAAQQFFDKQSTGYRVLGAVSSAFHAAEVALAIASIAPKIAAGAASMFATLGPFAWPAIGAMVATMAALGFASSGGGGGPSSATRQEKQGTGSVLGNETAKSDSIQKSLDIIAKDSGLGLVHFQSMDVSLKAVVAGLTGLSTSLVQFGGINTLGKQISGNQSGGFLGGVINSIFGGKTSVQDAGVMFGSSTVGGIASNGINAQSYNDLKKSGGWFSSDSYSTQTKSLGDAVNKQIADIVNNMATTISAAATQLGVGGDAFQDHLKSFVVDLGKISLKDMTGEEVDKALNAIFSKLGDDMAMFAVEGLEPFRKIGEGYLETLSRVANDLVQVQDVFAMFGKTLQSTGLDAIKVSEGLISAFGSVDKLTSATKSYIDNFFTDAEKIVPIQKSVSSEMERLGKSSVTTVDQFKALVSSLDLTVDSDQKLYASLMNVAPAFKQVADAAQVIVDKQKDLNMNLLSAKADAETDSSGPAHQALLIAQRKEEMDALNKLSPSLLATQQAIYDTVDAAVALKKAQDAANSASALQIQILELQDKHSEALTITRAKELANTTDANKAAQLQIYALQDQASALEASNRTATLNATLLGLQGKSSEALAITREIELQKMNESDAALQKRIYALQDEKEAFNKTAALNIQISTLLGDKDAALVATRQLEISKMSGSDKVLQERIYALQDEATALAAANTTAGIQAQVLELQGKHTEALAITRGLELQKMSASDQVLQQRVYWLQDEAAAVEKANTTASLNATLLGLQNKTSEALVITRAIEMQKMTAGDRVIQMRIYALQDEAKALEVANVSAGLQAQILELQGKHSESLAITRSIELQKMTEGDKELQKRIYALQDEATALAAANTTAGLNAQILELQGKHSESIAITRGIELQKMAEGDKILQQRIWSLQDEAAALSKQQSLESALLTAKGLTYEATVKARNIELASLAITNANLVGLQKQVYAAEDAARTRSLEVNLLNELKRSSEALAITRKAEMAALSDSDKKIQQSIYDAQDRAQLAASSFAVLSKAVSAAKADNQAAYDATVANIEFAKTAATNSYNSFKDATNASIKVSQDAAAATKELSSSLQSTLDAMLSNTEMAMSRVSAQGILSSALETAKATGVLPTAASMKDALSTLGKDSSGSFSSYIDYVKDLGITAGKVAELKSISDTQTTAAEQQVKLLQDSLDAAEKQYNATISGFTAQTEAAKLMLDTQNKALDAELAKAQEQLDVMNGTNVAIVSLATAISNFSTAVNSAIAGQARPSAEIPSQGVPTPVAVDPNERFLMELSKGVLKREATSAELTMYEKMMNSGSTGTDVALSMMHTPEYATINGSHANGLDNVPFDGYTAKLHKGEMVLPAKQAKGVAQGSDMAAVVEAINNLKDDNSAENQSMVSDIRFLKKLFQNISPNGQTLQVTQTVVS